VTHYLSVEGLFKLEVTHGEPFWEAIKAKQDYLTLLEKEEAVAIHVGEDILPLQAPVLSDGALRLVRRGTSRHRMPLFWQAKRCRLKRARLSAGIPLLPGSGPVTL